MFCVLFFLSYIYFFTTEFKIWNNVAGGGGGGGGGELIILHCQLEG